MSSRFADARPRTEDRGLERRASFERVWLAVPALALLATLLGARGAASERTPRSPVFGLRSQTLRVCADPNNLPFSNARGEGLENHLAALVAREMGARVEYTWWAQRRGFFRNTLNAGKCDVVMGVPTALDMVAHTRPYYRSTYVFVSRRDRHLDVRSLEDAVLRRVTVGVQLMGDDGIASPPAHVLARHGVVNNVRGYSIQGDYREPNPPARIVDAVVKGDVDVAIVWGPLAGYFAKRSPVPLAIVPVPQATDAPRLPFAFDMAIGVRRRDAALRDTLDAILVRRRAEIGRLLDEFGVPRVERGAKQLSAGRELTADGCQPSGRACGDARSHEPRREP